jgi:hypothetical protein
LQIRWLIVVTVSIDVIYHACCTQNTSLLAGPAQRFFTKYVRTDGAPSRAVGRQSATRLPLALASSAVPLTLICPVGVAVARLRQHRTTTRVSAGRRINNP